MLILRRKVGESFLVGDQIRVTILDMEANGTVNIGIDAPKDVLILRSDFRQPGRRAKPVYPGGRGPVFRPLPGPISGRFPTIAGPSALIL